MNSHIFADVLHVVLEKTHLPVARSKKALIPVPIHRLRAFRTGPVPEAHDEGTHRRSMHSFPDSLHQAHSAPNRKYLSLPFISRICLSALSQISTFWIQTGRLGYEFPAGAENRGPVFRIGAPEFLGVNHPGNDLNQASRDELDAALVTSETVVDLTMSVKVPPDPFFFLLPWR